ncbi:MAG: DUF5979 domain-containing protein [Actinomyces urogenitalis]|uniref:DUF5979 domain-containing protein n=1 Tax=Actinomyces urogenitalis TaxID=103621 RepID=UPI002A80E91D|nr:DUF5979 domain-containing protein [Actinomyces urogenitalis]MDY3677605.1 DUF5979 domain-containing protein [Actinomyces urogenitalis]
MTQLMPRRLRHSSPPRRSALVALLAVLALVLPTLAAPAAAEVNQDIKVTNLALKHIDASENEQPGKPRVGSSLTLLTFDWDGRNATIKDGDSFSVGLPQQLEYKVQSTKPFTYDFGDGQQVEVGSCTMEARTMTCTFNAEMERRVQAGYHSAFGSGKVHLSVVEATDESELPFVINGTQTLKVQVPGGGITKGTDTYTPVSIIKYATGLDENSSRVSWGLNFGTEKAQEAFAAQGKQVKFDGVTSQTLVFEDKLGPGQTCLAGEHLSRTNLVRTRSATAPDGKPLPLTNGGSTMTTEAGTFSMNIECGTPTSEGTPMTITVSGPFAPRTNYDVNYPTPVDSVTGKAMAGFVYHNSVTLKGTVLSAQTSKSFVESFGISVQMKLGYGTFKVSKYIAGGGASQVAPGTSFPLTVRYELPKGATRADYPEWDPPGTLNADQRTGTATFDAVLGQMNTFTGPTPPVTFPKGTTITLSEDTSGIELPPGYAWSEPEFVVDGKTTNTFAIADQKIVGVDLTNTVEVVPSYFQVRKEVTGAKVQDKTFTFSYDCSDGTTGTVTAKGDGKPVRNSQPIVVGSTCTVTEDVDSAEVEGHTLDTSAAQPQTVTITPEGQGLATASFTNAYTRDVGRFVIRKVIEGDYPHLPQDTAMPTALTQEGEEAQEGQAQESQDSDDDYLYETFLMHYSCNDPACSAGTLDVSPYGGGTYSPAIPAGTTCVIREDPSSAERDGYAVSTEVSASSVTIVKDREVPVTVTNTYRALKGGFTVAKTVDGDGAGLAADREFTFEYSCKPETGKSFSDQVKVKGGQVAEVTDVPVGTCTIKELDASVDKTQVSTSLTVDGSSDRVRDGVATIEVAEGSTVKVAATNTYTLDRGGFSVAKKVEGDDAKTLKDRTFDFHYTCTSVEGTVSGDINGVKGDGSAVPAPAQLPLGARCTVEEKAASAQVEGYDVKTPEPQTLTIKDKDTTAALSFVNTYTRHLGTFSVLKTVTGAEVGDKEFTFSYDCTNGTQGSLRAKADGKAITGPSVPTGTSCTIQEKADSAEVEGYNLAMPAARSVTVSEKNQVVETSFTNTYTPVPSSTPTPKETKPRPGKGLARTGAVIAVPVLLAAGAVVAGTLLVRRRHQ